MKTIVFIIGLLSLMQISPKATARELSAFTKEVRMSSRLFVMQKRLIAGKEYKFATFSRFEIDPRIHIVHMSSNEQVTFNDDCNLNCMPYQTSYDSVLKYTPEQTGYYRIIFRNSADGMVGETTRITIYENGGKILDVDKVPLGGVKIPVGRWKASYNNQIQFYYHNSSRENDGPIGNDSVLFLIKKFNEIISYDDDSGAHLASKINKNSDSCDWGCYALGGSYYLSPDSEGKARLIVDKLTRTWSFSKFFSYKYNDADGDTLSDELEDVLKTDKTKKDTDEDGLLDWVEVYGKGNILLPWEGADPLKKDIFIEVDYMTDYVGGNYIDYFALQSNTVINNLIKSFKKYDDAQIHVDVDDKLPRYTFISCEGSVNNYTTNMKELIDYFSETRVGIYHWAVVGIRSSSGASGEACDSDRFYMTLGSTNNDGGTNDQRTTVFMHELGHNLGLSHNGNGNLNGANSEIHKSIMNYRYSFNGVTPISSDEHPWRYSIDNSVNTQELEWKDGIGCLPLNKTLTSPKQMCIETAQLNPSASRNESLKTCDCTFNEWRKLDYTSNGYILDALLNSEKTLSDTTAPVVGIGGHILAENSTKGMKVGKNYSKIRIKSSKNTLRAFESFANISLSKKIKTDELTKKYHKKIIEKYERKGFKRGRDFKIVNGKPLLGLH